MRFLFVDRILQLVPGQLTRGIKNITLDDWYLYENQPNEFCLASSIIGEALGQLAAWNVMLTTDFTHRPIAGIVASACLHRPAYVGETLLLESFIDVLDDEKVQYHSIARVGAEIVFTIEGALGPLLPMNQFIDDKDVRLQFAEINRPGWWPPVETLPTSPLIASQIRANNYACLQFDTIIKYDNFSLVAQKKITRAAPYFPDHFPRNPVLPMTILLECIINLAYLFLEKVEFGYTYTVHELRKIKMNGFVQPGDVLECQINVLQQDNKNLILRYRNEVTGKRVCVLEMVMIAKDA